MLQIQKYQANNRKKYTPNEAFCKLQIKPFVPAQIPYISEAIGGDKISEDITHDTTDTAKFPQIVPKFNTTDHGLH